MKRFFIILIIIFLQACATSNKQVDNKNIKKNNLNISQEEYVYISYCGYYTLKNNNNAIMNNCIVDYYSQYLNKINENFCQSQFKNQLCKKVENINSYLRENSGYKNLSKIKNINRNKIFDSYIFECNYFSYNSNYSELKSNIVLHCASGLYSNKIRSIIDKINCSKKDILCDNLNYQLEYSREIFKESLRGIMYK